MVVRDGMDQSDVADRRSGPGRCCPELSERKNPALAWRSERETRDTTGNRLGTRGTSWREKEEGIDIDTLNLEIDTDTDSETERQSPDARVARTLATTRAEQREHVPADCHCMY